MRDFAERVRPLGGVVQSFSREIPIDPQAQRLHDAVRIAMRAGHLDGDGMIADRHLAAYFESIGYLRDAIRSEVRTIVCMDEDVSPGTDVAGFHISGSGELEDTEAAKVRATARRLGRKLVWAYHHEGEKITEVTKHEDCGAGKMAFDPTRCAPERFGLPSDTEVCHNTYARHSAPILAEYLTDYIEQSEAIPANEKWEVTSRFITLDEMGYPDGTRALHTAPMVTYDGTGRINAKDFKGLPKTFQVSRRFMMGQSAERDAVIAANIALGQHGLGSLDYFTPERPLVMLGVADTTNPRFRHETIDREMRVIVGRLRGHGRHVIGTVINLADAAN